MIVYSVTVCIENDIKNEWLSWMKEIHIPEVMQTGFFQDYRILKVLTEQENESGHSYNIQYDCDSLDALEKYQKQHAPKLQKEHTDRYSGKFFAFRTILEKV